MKKLLIPRYIRYNLFTIIAIICMLSCTNQDKEYTNSFYKMESTKEDPVIDFNTMTCLNESNLKAIELSSISLRLSKNLETLQILLKIKRDNKKINSDFKKLTKENLIIIPSLIYHINLNEDSINNEKSDLYILEKLKTEIKQQITSFDNLEKKTQNIDFKLFAKESKKTLQANNEALKTLLSD
jgi:hypothetical protein